MAFILWNSFFTLDFFLTRDTRLVPCALCLVPCALCLVPCDICDVCQSSVNPETKLDRFGLFRPFRAFVRGTGGCRLF